MTSKHENNDLQQNIQSQLNRFREYFVAHNYDFPTDKRLAQLSKILIASRYFLSQVNLHIDWLHELFTEQFISDRLNHDVLLATCLAHNNIDAVKKSLRLFRHRVLIELMWLDFLGAIDLKEVLRRQSQLADICVDIAVAVAQQQLLPKYGKPKTSHDEEQGLVVIALGKLGGNELNFSSDIDLIFSYAKDGLTDGEKELSCAEYFRKVTNLVIDLLSDVTVDGFVFRVDLRLRPFGTSGQVASSFDALEDYYQREGRDWERYAWIKARPLTGKVLFRRDLERRLKPFIYRRYIDFSIFDALREMKANINAEVIKKSLQDNIKLGLGGIREIEFIVQALQLIHGGKYPVLQSTEIFEAFHQLAKLKLLPKETVDLLSEEYTRLRILENHLQYENDQQTHVIPSNQKQREAIAYGLEISVDNMLQESKRSREKVHECFRDFLESSDHRKDSSAWLKWQQIWEQEYTTEEDYFWLKAQGYNKPELIVAELNKLKKSTAYRRASARSKLRLSQFMPMLLASCAQRKVPDLLLERLMVIILAVIQRSVYLLFFKENPKALGLILELCESSVWITELIAQYPILLDTLFDLNSDLNIKTFRHDLKQYMWDIEITNLEKIMDTFRYFQQEQKLKIARAELIQQIDISEVCEVLSDLATVLIENAYTTLKQYLKKENRGNWPNTEFAIIAYGKLGSYEMSYNSDLDLVFLFQEKSGSEASVTQDDTRIYSRLVQRLIHFLNIMTPAGKLYEVDTRLRPNGGAGMLVSHLNGFRKYQLEQAWNWELQALVRARCIVGSTRMIESFNLVKKEILCRDRDEVKLKQDILSMRKKINQYKSKDKENAFDIKYSNGGLVDIEFLVQFLVLKWAHQYPVLAEKTKTYDLLTILGECEVLPISTAKNIIDIYFQYLHKINQAFLQKKSPLLDGSLFVDEREFVSQVWDFYIK